MCSSLMNPKREIGSLVMPPRCVRNCVQAHKVVMMVQPHVATSLVKEIRGKERKEKKEICQSKVDGGAAWWCHLRAALSEKCSGRDLFLSTRSLFRPRNVPTPYEDRDPRGQPAEATYHSVACCEFVLQAFPS